MTLEEERDTDFGGKKWADLREQVLKDDQYIHEQWFKDLDQEKQGILKAYREEELLERKEKAE